MGRVSKQKYAMRIRQDVVDVFRRNAKKFVGTRTEINIYNQRTILHDYFDKDRFLEFCDEVERGEI